MAFSLDQPSQVTGMRRAFHELCVGISAQKCVEDMQKAMIGHACRAMTSRLIMEMAAAPGQFASGGMLKQ